MRTRFQYYSLADASKAQGAVVVIDVLRAFTTAAFAFNAGSTRIYPVSGIEEAFLLKQRFPQALIMGEDQGVQVPGFDFGNSPAQIKRAVLAGKTMIQRTTAGTQGIILSNNANELLAASFVCSGATAVYLRHQHPADISFIITGASHGRDGDEDLACGEYIQALISGEYPDPDEYLARVGSSSAGRVFFDGKQPDMDAVDLELCLMIDAFNFAMPVFREDGLLVMKRRVC